MVNRERLLYRLLRPLVQEWGYKEVEAALSHLNDDTVRVGTVRLHEERNQDIERRQSKRLLAVEQVARAHLPRDQEESLQELATRFDQKQFLPSVSDAKEFLMMMGEKPGAIKDRSDAFRRLLDALLPLTPERLRQLAKNSALHSGPSKLGPLSDAISSAAQSLSRYREPNE